MRGRVVAGLQGDDRGELADTVALLGSAARAPRPRRGGCRIRDASRGDPRRRGSRSPPAGSDHRRDPARRSRARAASRPRAPRGSASPAPHLVRAGDEASRRHRRSPVFLVSGLNAGLVPRAPDHRRHRNSTGSASRMRGSRTVTAGSESHRPRNTLTTLTCSGTRYSRDATWATLRSPSGTAPFPPVETRLLGGSAAGCVSRKVETRENSRGDPLFRPFGGQRAVGRRRSRRRADEPVGAGRGPGRVRVSSRWAQDRRGAERARRDPRLSACPPAPPRSRRRRRGRAAWRRAGRRG